MSWKLCALIAFSDTFRSQIKPSDPAMLVEVRAQDDGPLRDLLELRLTALSPVLSPKHSRSLSPLAEFPSLSELHLWARL
jgi:hypothetical protein